ncbi:MAG: asparaginase [Bacteroidales bacterium]|nr:asparaginase [Bacteroidales bacterium]MCF8387554.1 asparaginase [Bacteroidales bacterium]MCF8399586.1 asparaginase [Bacteroidales bacterium]
MESKTAILIIYTGGTVGMIKDPETGSLKPFNFEYLFQHIPVLERMNYHIDYHTFDPLVDSSNMKPSFWVKLAGIIEEKYEEYDGFVVLHGSDTMAYTASALSFMFENLNKPVILTGAQLPLDLVRSDGRDNIINSVEIAAAKKDDIAIVPEVAICFENYLYRGNRTSKFNAEHFEAFLSGNYPALAEVGVKIKYNRNYIQKPNFKKLKVHDKLENNVAILKLFPGITQCAVESLLNTQDLKAVILETFGSGNAPTDGWFLDALKKAIDRGMYIYNVTQCKSGTVEMGLYETSADLEKMGVIGGYDITTESAIAKMMYLLGEGYKREKVIALMRESLRGELTKQ